MATASRAINCVPTVRPALAKRVRKAVAEIGYVPNTHARALVSGRSRIFGLMVPEITNPFFPEIVQTFQDLGVEYKYEILLSSIGGNQDRPELAVRRMVESRVDGVALLTFGRERAFLESFRQHSLPAVVVDGEPSFQLKTIRIDYEHGIRQAVQHLAALRHVRIAFISGPSHSNTAMARKAAFQECMNEIGLTVFPEMVIEGDHTMEAGIRAMSALAAGPVPPSAVVCSNDMTAIGVIREAFDLALDVPQDLSVVGFDDIHFARFTAPPLTTVRLSQVEIAQLAFRALLDAVEFHRNGDSQSVYTVKTDLVIRNSTALASKQPRTDERTSRLGSSLRR